VKRFNVLTGELELESEREGHRWRRTRVGERIGAERIGASLYVLDDGQRVCPYHFHHGIEEWLYVVAGEPTMRTAAGERPLRAGDVVCFPARAEGAHTVRGPGRVLIFSAGPTSAISVYPDSAKLGIRPSDRRDRLNFRRADAVDYWEGE
jgi:uncharacterized cupin superfamily protein